MKHVAALIISGTFFLPILANAASSTVTPQGKDFLNYSVQDSLGEISLCQMAQQKSTNAGVKSFCTRAISDHKNMAAQAKQVAQQLGVSVTQQPSDESQTEKQKLSKLSGAQFDSEFLQGQVKDHKKDISKAQSVQNEAQNVRVKSLIAQSLPVLQTHLKLATTTLEQLQSTK